MKENAILFSKQNDRTPTAIASAAPYAEYISGSGSNTLVTIFSHVDIEPGKFGQFKAVQCLDGDRVYLNARNNDWFTSGIKPLSNSIPETIKRVAEWSEGRKAVFVGHSMGAYLSLIAGNVIPNSRFISTSPELFLNLPFSRSHNNNVPLHAEWSDIRQLTQQLHGNPNGLILFGAYDPIDCYFLSRAEEFGGFGEFYEVPHHHGVTEYFTGRGRYEELLVEGKDSVTKFQALGMLSPLNTYGTSEQYRHFYETFRVLRSGENSDLLEQIRRHDDWCNPGWQELRSQILQKSGDQIGALEAAERAYLFEPALMMFIERYATACIKAGEGQKLGRVIDGLTDAQLRHPVGKRLLNRARSSFGEVRFYAASKDIDYVKIPSPYSHKFESRKPANFELRSLFSRLSDKDYDRVATDTFEELGQQDAIHVDVVAARALALSNVGDVAQARQLLIWALSTAKVHTQRLGRAVLDVSRRTRDIDLLEKYFDLYHPSDEVRQRLASRVAGGGYDFVSEPVLAAKLVREIILWRPADADSTADIIRAVKSKNGIPQFIRSLLRSITLADISADTLKELSRITISCGHRAEAAQLDRTTDKPLKEA